MALDTFNPYLFVSSGEQSNKFLTPTYADGIAEFQAQRAQSLTGLTVRIDPIQEGTGDPSPTNVRPISGRTGMTVTRAGKNLCSGLNVFNAQNRVTPIMRLSGGIAYTFSCNSTLNALGIYVRKGSTISIIDSIAPVIKIVYSTTTVTFTPPETGDYFIQLYRGGDGWTIEPNNVQVEAGTSATTYTPYVAPPTEYPITWQTEAGTIYGGTLDVVSGVLTVTDALIASYDGETLPSTWISDRDVYAEGTTPTTGAQVVYKLATPQTYRLTGAEVRMIPGFNQIYSDAGPVIDIKF